MNPRVAHERIVTTRISSAIAPGMFAPRAAAAAAARGAADSANEGSTASSSAETMSVGTSSPRLPANPTAVTSAVMTGGPSATPTLPPSENQESAVALRSPATLVAVL